MSNKIEDELVSSIPGKSYIYRIDGKLHMSRTEEEMQEKMDQQKQCKTIYNRYEVYESGQIRLRKNNSISKILEKRQKSEGTE